MKNKLVKFTIIIFVVASVAIIGGNEKAIHNSSQFNEITKNMWESADVVTIPGDLYGYATYNESTFALANLNDYWRVHSQVSTEVPTEAPTEAQTEAPTETPTEAPTQKTTQKPASTEKPKDTPTDNPSAIITDDEARAKAIVLNNSYRNMVSTILTETNAIRSGVGASALSENATLTQMAMFRAAEMANSTVLSHTRPNGLACFTVYDIYTYAYTSAGENLAWNSDNLRSPVGDWKGSKGHYENMISTAYNQIGIGVAPGVYNGTQGFYYVQVFSN